MKKALLTIALIFATVLIYPAHGQFGKKLTPEIISSNGTKTYDVPKDSLLNYAKNALIENGYKILVFNQSKGLIKTDRKYLKSAAVGNGTTAEAIDYTRQYIVTVEEITPSKSKVVFKPKIYAGETDISEKGIWVLKGNSGEFKIWENLFKNLEEYMQ